MADWEGGMDGIDTLEDLGAVAIRGNPAGMAAALRFGAAAAKRAPATFKRYMKSQTRGGKGGIIERCGLLFAARGLTVGADGTITEQSLKLYRRGTADADAVLGDLTGQYTNVESSGQLEAGRNFLGKSMSFAVVPVEVPAAMLANPEMVALWLRWYKFRAYAEFNLGATTKIPWGPIVAYPGPDVAIGGALACVPAVSGTPDVESYIVGATHATSVGDWRAAFQLDPPIRLRAKQSFGVTIVNPSEACPGVAASANGLKVAVYHFLSGSDRFAVEGMAG